MNKLLGWWSDKDIVIVDQIGNELRGHKIWNTPGVLKLIYEYTDAAHRRMPAVEELEDICKRQHAKRPCTGSIKKNPDPRWSHFFYADCDQNCITEIAATAFGGRKHVLCLPNNDDEGGVVMTIDELQRQGIRCIVTPPWVRVKHLGAKAKSVLDIVTYDTKDIALINPCWCSDNCPIASIGAWMDRMERFVFALIFLGWCILLVHHIQTLNV
jgi:hypothetical protein